MGVKTEIEYKCSEYKRRGATDEEHGHSKRRLGAKWVLSYRKHFEVAKGRWNLSTAEHSIHVSLRERTTENSSVSLNGNCKHQR